MLESLYKWDPGGLCAGHGCGGGDRVYSLLASPEAIPMLLSKITQGATCLCIHLCPHFLWFPWNRLPGGELVGGRREMDFWFLILIGQSLSPMDMPLAPWSFSPTAPLPILKNKHFQIPVDSLGDKLHLLVLTLTIQLPTSSNFLIVVVCIYIL